MNNTDESPLIAETEGPAVGVLNAAGQGNVVLVCEHASRFIPASLLNLGLDAEAKASHAAWDIGAMDLAMALMGALDAPLVASRVSRLVYDCNRPPEAPDAVPMQSERFGIPGNRALSAEAMAARVQEVYLPFRAALADTLAQRPIPSMLVTIHSFTPVYMGQARDVELGLLHDTDARAAEAMLRVAGQHTGMKTALNEPYAAKDGVTHTLREHAIVRRLPNVMIEVRNDLVDTSEGVRQVGAELASLLRDMIGEFPELTTKPAGNRQDRAG